MNKSLKDIRTPIVRHDAIKVEKYGEKVVVRIMLMKYDDLIEVYYQEGYPYEFAYGVASFEGFKETLRMAQLNVYNWGCIMKNENAFKFYKDRISACPSYGFKSGHEILQTVTRCAFWDSTLTLDEFNSIMILAEKAHIEMMEENYNAGWQDNQ